MPGFIQHFIAGNAMFLIGSVLIFKYSSIPKSRQNTLLLYLVCIISSMIPDFPLGLYFIFHLQSYQTLLPIHTQVHYIISPLATITFIALAGLNIIKKKPIWIMGLFCIFLHIIMDATIHEINVYF